MSSFGSNSSTNTSSNGEKGKTWETDFHTMLAILAVVIIIFNVPVIILYYKISSLRYSAGNTFLVGLAVADLLCACVMIPLAFPCDLQVFDDPHHHRLICVSYFVANFTVSIASIYLIVAATVAKYFAIVYPVRNITACTSSRVKFSMIIIWVVALIVGHIPVYMLVENDEHQLVTVYTRFVFVFAFVIPAFVLTCIHVHIYARLFLKSRPTALVSEGTARLENNQRIAVVFLLLSLFFFISWLPWYLVFAEMIQPTTATESVFGICRFIASVFNPIMFTFVKRDFRTAAFSFVSGIRGRRGTISRSMRSHTQATRMDSSVDRSNIIEPPNNEEVLRIGSEYNSVVTEHEKVRIV